MPLAEPIMQTHPRPLSISIFFDGAVSMFCTCRAETPSSPEPMYVVPPPAAAFASPMTLSISYMVTASSPMTLMSWPGSMT
jgi:hypothetical protein